MNPSMQSEVAQIQRREPQRAEKATRTSAKADIRDLCPEARKRIAYQVRMSSSEAARKEWGTNQTAALEAFLRSALWSIERRLERLEDAVRLRGELLAGAMEAA